MSATLDKEKGIVFVSVVVMSSINSMCVPIVKKKIQLLQIFFAILLRWYKRFVWFCFFRFLKLFPAFNWTNNIGSLVNNELDF